MQLCPAQPATTATRGTDTHQLSATRTVTRSLLVSMPFLSDEPVANHEDPADRKRRIRSEREQRVYRGVAEQIAIRYSHEDWSRRAHENTTKTADATIRAAVPGENLLTPDAFRAVLELAFPLIDYPKQHRQAKRSGRLQWGGGVVFVRAAE